MLEASMPRYFFHLKYGSRVVADEEGLYLHDLTRARGEIIEIIRQILSEPGLEYKNIDGQALEISNEAGDTVLVITF
jgi:hypothetical protein